ncbi:hypothetical protein Tco_0225584, partial [Tanacetum coccineum]
INGKLEEQFHDCGKKNKKLRKVNDSLSVKVKILEDQVYQVEDAYARMVGELAEAKSNLVKQEADLKEMKHELSLINHFLHVDFGHFFRKLLKSTEFNRALGGILPLTVNSGVESGNACVKISRSAENTLEEVVNLESDKLPPRAFVAQVFSAAPASDPSCKPFCHISTSDA